MRRYSSQQRLGALSDLNVTPLLDLAFVLLIIFMITAPFLAESADLVVPTSKASRDAVDPANVFTLAIDKNRVLTIDGKPVEKAALPAAIAVLKKQKPNLAALIRADRDLPVQELVDLMDALKVADITKVGVVTKGDGAP